MQSVVFGASGTIGGALARKLKARGDTVWEFSMFGPAHTDISDENMIAAAPIVPPPCPAASASALPWPVPSSTSLR